MSFLQTQKGCAFRLHWAIDMTPASRALDPIDSSDSTDPTDPIDSTGSPILSPDHKL